MTTTPSGLVLLNKPEGITSFRVLGTIKNKLKTAKVGHTGTLDKFAEGLMLVLTGRMTKLAPFFSNLDKEYIAVFKFGEETNTLDPEGDIVASEDIPSIKTIESRIDGFKGSVLQRPPDFSAIHINGKRAYKLAAAGKKPDIPEREIRIDEFTILDWKAPFLQVRVKCSKGTYIRSLARDLGRACSSRAYVNSLKRTEVGSWNLKDAVIPELFDPVSHTVSGRYLFDQIDGINKVTVSNIVSDKILQGVPVYRWQNEIQFLPGDTAVFTEDGRFISLITNNNDKLFYRFVGTG